MVENRLQRPSGVYVCPVFSSRTCVDARHVILMVLHVLYQATVRSCSCLFFDNINCGAVLHHFVRALYTLTLPPTFIILASLIAIFFFLRSFCYFLFYFFFKKKIHFSLKLFLICSYFSGDFNLTVLIKCVLNKKKVYYSSTMYD